MPAGVRHSIVMSGNVTMRTLYLRHDAAAGMPEVCRVLQVSPLLRELILEACNLSVEYDLDGRDGRIMALILDEIAEAVEHPASALHVPMPSNPRLLKVCRAVMQDPAQEDDLDKLADAVRVTIGPKKRPTTPVPNRCTTNRPIRMTMPIGTTNGASWGARISSPSTAPSTEMAGVMTLSP